ncbi:hypothetical protein [Neobacillus soli]|uniref:hypothetical protein n=1 Tax=Neobacillus soli TaxID=220688 RepID=UPI000824176C|nr:hypothetical protein [Neobacillus soli]
MIVTLSLIQYTEAIFLEVKKEKMYSIHKLSKGTYEDLNKMMYKINSYRENLPIVKMSKSKALMELLTIHSELAFLHVNGNAKNIPDLNPALDERQNERFIQESLKWAVKWIFDYCNDDMKNMSFKPSRKELINMLIFSYKYEMLREILFSASRGAYSIKIDNKKIEFVTENDNHHAFLAYNSWRQAHRERLQLDNIKTRNISAIQELQSSEFIMPETWNLGDYTLKEYKSFSVSLDGLLTRWMMNHAKKNPIIFIGQYKSQDLIKVFDKKWWVSQISKLSGLSKDTVENIITDLTYVNRNNNDPAYQFFIPLSEKKLALSVCFTNVFVRPERNLMALLPKLEDKSFHRLSNDCENQQINLIKKLLDNKKIIIGEKRTKAQEKRSGMDILFLDCETLDLLIVELKWTISPSTTSEMYAVDEHVKKGLNSLPIAYEYITQNIDAILLEYFGPQYKGKRPRRYENCVVMNESIGTGRYSDPLAHVITLDHLIELLNKGLGHTIDTLQNKKHRIPNEFYSEVPVRFKINEYEIHCSGTDLEGEWLDHTLPALNSNFI